MRCELQKEIRLETSSQLYNPFRENLNIQFQNFDVSGYMKYSYRNILNFLIQEMKRTVTKLSVLLHAERSEIDRLKSELKSKDDQLHKWEMRMNKRIAVADRDGTPQRREATKV